MNLEKEAKKELNFSEGIKQEEILKKVNLKYQGTDSTFSVNFSQTVDKMQGDFEQDHQMRYGFIQPQKSLIIESISLEFIQKMDTPAEPKMTRTRPLNELPKPIEMISIFTHNAWYDTPIYRREDLEIGDIIKGTAIIIEKISTIIVEPNWNAKLTKDNHLILSYQKCHKL
jgi:5-oxoprolinase (ATP-hydrolysing)